MGLRAGFLDFIVAVSKTISNEFHHTITSLTISGSLRIVSNHGNDLVALLDSR